MLRTIALAALAAPAMGALHSLPEYVNGWRQSAEVVSMDAQVTVTLCVKEQGAEEVRLTALQVSDPSSASYGEYLTKEQVMTMTAPKAEDMSAVTGWLNASNVHYQLRHSNVVASMSVADASTLFNTDFHVATHRLNGQSLIRASDYEIPAAIEASIATVFGLHGLPLPPRQAMIIAAHAAGAQPVKVTPDVLESTYGISGVKVSRSAKNTQAVAEFQGQFMNSTDLKVLFKTFEKKYEEGTDDVVSKFVGKHEENSGGVEAELDIQYMMGISVGIKTQFWEFPGNDFGADLNQWTSNLTAGTPDTPIVHSVSYGWQGNLSQIHVKDSDVDTVDKNFQKLAAMGVSIMISSGDSGSGFATPHATCGAGKEGEGIDGEARQTLKGVPEINECQQICGEINAKGWSFIVTAPDQVGKEKRGDCTLYSSVKKSTTANSSVTSGVAKAAPKGNVVLWPSWPASSPWVTAVGATRFVGQKVGNDEMATDQFGSGGGFSSQFDQTNAQWQAKATAEYLKTVDQSTLPPADSYPAKGRGTPDVSALGEGYQVIVGGHANSVGGTSASSPAFAGMVSMLNEARLNAGKKPMGFLNPFLYSNEDAFTDVVEGSNKVGRGGNKLPYGYNCSKGWDPATGLGTPLFQKLLTAALK